MKLKRVCLLLFGVLFFLLLSEIKCISNNYNHVKNLISDEERRAADANEITDQNNAETKLKRGLYATESHEKPQYHSGYGASGGGHIPAATFSNPGYSYGPPAPSGHFGSGYGYPSGHGSSPSYGHGSSLGGSSYGISSGGTGGGGYGHSGHGGGYGPPSGHGGSGHHGHSSLALKGLLIPLAGIALLGAAAALSTNPVLLQLGVVGKRRRRSLEYQNSYQDKIYPANPNVQPDSN